MTDKAPSLHTKLAEVMAAIDWQPKTETNKAQGYRFVSVEVIKDAVRTECAKRRVMIYTSIDEITRSEYETKNKTTMYHVLIQGTLTFVDGDTGESHTIEAAGEASDTGDKALNKAQTAMVKYALISTFLIPTGDDPDTETPATRASHPPRPAPSGHAALAGPAAPGAPLLDPKAVQCESHSPLDGTIQCRMEQGHSGPHKTHNETW